MPPAFPRESRDCKSRAVDNHGRSVSNPAKGLPIKETYGQTTEPVS